MAMALRASGRDILFSACNWGVQEPWNWMRSIGAHMYRSTGDIVDTFASTADIRCRQSVCAADCKIGRSSHNNRLLQ